MRWRASNFVRDPTGWHPWFAWHPTTVGDTVVWLERVERMMVVNSVEAGPEYQYRFPNSTEAPYPNL